MAIAPVKGTKDIYKDEALYHRYVSSFLRSTVELYGFKEIETPVLEHTEVFTHGTGESSDVVRKEMYTFEDKGSRSVTMRPEFTAGIVRSIVSNKWYATEDLPLKMYYHGPAFRYERPQLGRYRQFHQFGVEEIGLDSARADAEIVIMAIHSLSVLGFKNVKLKINSIGDAESRNNYKKALVEYFSSRIDEMCPDCKERLELNPLRILDCKVPADQEIAKGAPSMKDYLSEASEKRFYETLSIINDFGIEYEVDDGLVRGLDYYSEMVFEIHILSEEGKDYGAVCGGGHYGGLVKLLGGPDLPGVGYAMGVERVVSLMQDNHLLDDVKETTDVYVMPIGQDMLDDAFTLTMNVRSLGYSAETPMANMKMGAMFKKAEKRGCKIALILGEEELNSGVVQMKNLETQVQKTVALDDLEDVLNEELNPSSGCGCGCSCDGDCDCEGGECECGGKCCCSEEKN
ncbi:MAG: histidine--tRNA ligase [Bacilli bacterium]|nr:histidine--tRNA ligase [Bacilli bacterium]